jgi:mannose-1-phosphate guanylyltransferase
MKSPTIPEAPVITVDAPVSEILPGEEAAVGQLLDADAAMWAVVLAGGIGSRFWPLSSPARPKQLLRLIGDRPMISDSISRLHPLVPPERTLVLTSADIAGAIAAAIPEVPARNLLVEPRPLGTAAALAWGAHEVARRAGPQTLACVMHADLSVAFPDAFRYTLRLAAGAAARDDVIATIGIDPTRVETGFGYIMPGELVDAEAPLAAGGLASVAAFVEKPAATKAAELIAAGALWHSGISVWRAELLIDVMRSVTPEISVGFEALTRQNLEGFAASVKPVSLERGVLERHPALVVAQGEFGWDDVGTWASLKRCRELDDEGNGSVGDVHFVDASGNIVHAEGSTVAMYGVDGYLVVTLPGITFVTTVERAVDLKTLIDALPPDVKRRIQERP